MMIVTALPNLIVNNLFSNYQLIILRTLTIHSHYNFRRITMVYVITITLLTM